VSIRQGLYRVLTEYPASSEEPFSGNELAGFIRHDLRDAIASGSGESDRLIFKGSAGQSTWARGPWVGIFNPVVTRSAQNGYYVCFLFREDMRGVYLSLNQGMTEAKENYKSDAKVALRARAQNFRAVLGSQVTTFPELVIDLSPSSSNNDTSFYEAGNICAFYYDVDSIPAEEKLQKDLVSIIALYETLIVAETGSDTSLDSEDDAPAHIDYEDTTRFRLHKRIERNALLIKKVKRIKGTTCEVCGTNFSRQYGPIGEGYIEAHHLRPLASLVGTKVPMNTERDFAVLCANCHRMVHRSGIVDDMQKFKEEHYHG
jgi:5-methylcytosine-specific restriction enzyme A